jgi:CheY-like chemotaxis protein
MEKKILIVEDNPQNMRLMEMLLGAKGYSLLKAIDGEEAVNLATTERPDLIIMDIQLPKINGFEATKILRQLPDFSHTPIIAITAYAMKGDREKLLAAGCDAYLSKPINTRELPRLISEMLSPPTKDKPGLEGDNDEPEDSGY